MSEKEEKQKAVLRIDGKSYEFPIKVGTEGERAIDISSLRKSTGLITLDPGYVNTGSCRSNITYLDGEQGILRHRGYAIEDLVEQCRFIEVAYLLIHDALPTRDELRRFSNLLNQHSMIHEDMRTFFRNYPEHAHPMAVLSAMVVSLSTFYPELEENEESEEVDITVTRLLSKLRTIAAYSYKKSVGEPFVYPSYKLEYCENFLNMMFSSPVARFAINPVVTRALDQLLIMHADHEQCCSTATVRLTGSSGANLYAAVSAGICSLWGPRHGGANQYVIEMLEQIHAEGGDVDKAVALAKDSNSEFRLMGFGHRVYKTYDPRARLAQNICRSVLEELGIDDPLLEIALRLEEKAVSDDYFQERSLYPNVDFYTGIIFRAMGIPTNLFTVLFAIGRLPGWIAQWMEWRSDPAQKIGRPRQLYTGPQHRRIVPLDKR